MKNHPVKLLFYRNTQGFRIVPHPVNTDINLPTKAGRGFRKIKSDDIGVEIVLEILAVDIQQVLICAEDIIKRNQAFPFLLCHAGEEGLQARAIPQREDCVLGEEVDLRHFTKFANKSKPTRLVLYHSRRNMKLSDLKPGQEAVITHFENNEIFLKLMEMGCVPGERILVEQVAPLGDPISVSISGYQLSLRISEADNIMVDIIN